MDISAHIGELLYDHDCVIIPGFGGFVCSYQPAAIHSEQSLVYPPGKAVSFNRSLQNNDGLLVNHLAGKKGFSFYEASETVNVWVNFSNSLLGRNEEIMLQHIGRFFNDTEGNLQFEPDKTANYLKSSFGLRTLTATPIARAKETNGRTRKLQPRDKLLLALRIAASVLILASIGLFGEMMRMDVHIKALELNQASVANFVDHLFHTEEKRMEPIPIPAQQTISHKVETNPATAVQEPLTPQPNVKEEPVKSPSPVSEEPIKPAPTVSDEAVPVKTNQTAAAYYIVVGAFKDEDNAENARSKLLLKFSSDNILFEKHGLLTKVGYYAGDNVSSAKQHLVAAQSEDATYWMLKK